MSHSDDDADEMTTPFGSDDLDDQRVEALLRGSTADDAPQLTALLTAARSLRELSAPAPSAALAAMWEQPAAATAGVIWLDARWRRRIATVAMLSVGSSAALVGAAAANVLPTSAQRVVARVVNDVTPLTLPVHAAAPAHPAVPAAPTVSPAAVTPATTSPATTSPATTSPHATHPRPTVRSTTSVAVPTTPPAALPPVPQKTERPEPAKTSADGRDHGKSPQGKPSAPAGKADDRHKPKPTKPAKATKAPDRHEPKPKPTKTPAGKDHGKGKGVSKPDKSKGDQAPGKGSGKSGG